MLFIIRERVPDMRYLMKHAIAMAFAAAFSVGAASACDFSRYVGWTITYSGNVTGYVEEDGETNTSFEGCEYDRVLIIDYDRSITCAGYGYVYAYNPEIVIISNGVSMQACIDDDMYAVRR